MTHSDRPPTRKPRRLWLYAPYVGLLIVIAIWSAGWLSVRQAAERRVDGEAQALRAAGWQVAWRARHVYGYPFRIDIDVDGLSVAEPGGWAVQIPALKTEARLFTPTHWLFAAPDGLTLTRPGRGAVTVTAELLRASLSDAGAHPPNLAFEGDEVAFAAAPGAKPFWLSKARVLQLYSRPGPNDQGALYASVDGGEPDPGSALARLAAGQPLDLKLEAVISHASALSRPGWRAAVANWNAAGGAIVVDRFEIAAPGLKVDAKGGTLTVGTDGRLVGTLPASLSGGPLSGEVPLRFEDDRTRLGPLDLGPSPSLF